MKLVILGGGGFRVPLVHGALLRDTADRRVTEVVLHDTDHARLDVMRMVLSAQAADAGGPVAPPTVTATTDLDTALAGADFVFSAMRVGGLEGRTADERIALDLGLLGQETTGPGGVGYGLRTVPVALDVARRIRRLAPEAWVINFTNPAGLVTQAMQSVLGDRVVGICDSPLGLAKRAAGALGHDLDDLEIDYAGLNHLGWLTGLRRDGRDVLPDLLADETALAAIEEGHLFGTDWLRTLGALPNEYLYYYYFTRDAIAQITERPADARGVPRRPAGRLLLGRGRLARRRLAAVGRGPARAQRDLHAGDPRGRRRRVARAGRGGRRGRRLRGSGPRAHGGDRP